MQITKLTNKSKITLLIVLLLILGLFGVGVVQARDWWGDAQDAGLDKIGKTAYKEDGQPKDIRIVAANIIKVFLGLFGTIFVILIVIGGYTWMTAGGDKEKVAKAGAYIKNGMIGLFITIAAFAIALYVTSRINWATQHNVEPTSATTQYYI